MRKAKPKKRIILPDPVYGDQKVSKFVNHLMFDGKKNVSYEIFYKSLEIVGEKMKDNELSPLEIWKAALSSSKKTASPKSKLNLVVSVVLHFKCPLKFVRNAKRVSL